MDTLSGVAHGDGLRLDAFVPDIVRRRLAWLPAPVLEPAAERFEAALLLTDLSDFTSLAESFAQRGPRGAEDLKDVLNFFCGHIVELIEAHGGEVLKFAGDAALALWRVDGLACADATRAAAQCATAAQRAFEEQAAPHGVRLRLRSGIGFGEVWAATVGGVAGRWELLVSGEPLSQAVHAVSAASSGEIALGAAAWGQLSPYARGRRVGQANVRLDVLTEPLPPRASSAIAACPDEWLRPYVPRSVQTRLDAAHGEWIAEFRRVSSLFIKLDGLVDGASDALDRLQRAVVTVQTAVYRYGGSINQLVVDDKGTVVVCGWGLAFHTYGDDPVRAVRAALEVRSRLQEGALNGSFGLASGTIFTGLLGNRRRCTFAMIGDVVNVAARLMEAAAPADILCDLATFEAASTRVTFEALAAVGVKGREQPVDVFRPLETAADGASEMVGRVRERQLLRERLEVLATANVGGVVILEGDPGIGKSRLVADLIQRAVTKGVRTMVASADAIERSTPYHVWCALFDKLLGLEGIAGRGGAERRVFKVLESNPRLAPFAPLLNQVLRLNFRETDESARVPPRGRALLTRDLLIHLFRHTAGSRATLLVLEDAHWLDSSSWVMAEAIVREVPEVLLLVSTRPLMPDEHVAEFDRLSQVRGTLRLHLDALAPHEAQALVCRRLRARALTEPVARLICDKAEGQPFFTEELAYALRDKGLIEVDHGVCRFTQGTAATDSVLLPNSVQVIIASRIDQLNADQQLTLKVASIFGRTFDRAALRAVYPIDVEVGALDGHVAALVERELVRASADAADRYSFKHAITQEAAYGLLPYALRRQLHAAAATWYERQHPDDLSPFFPLLAHHWVRAEAGGQATFYLDKAGEQALKRHANEEALRFYSAAVDIDERLAPPVPAAAPIVIKRDRVVSPREARRIRWERRLGDAAMNLSRWDDGRRHFTTLLSLMGQALPESDGGLTFGMGRQIGIQALHRAAPRLLDRSSDQAADLLREAVCAYERLGSLSYQNGHMVAVLYSLVAALNVAERLGPTAELALVYADVGNVLGLIPVHRLARVYNRMATETAARLPDQVAAARVRARAGLYRLGIGDWSACTDLESSMALCDLIGDSYVWEENAAIRARTALVTGDFERGAHLGAQVRMRAVANGSVPHEVWGMAIEAWANRFHGRTQHALDLARTGLHLLATSGRTDRLATLDFHGVMALVHADRTEWRSAQEAAERVIAAMALCPRLGYFSELAVSGALEACLAVWEQGHIGARSAETPAHVDHLCRHLESFARINPPARSRAALWRGCAEWLQGRPERAQRLWRRCLLDAERFALPYESARAHFEIGRRLERTNAERHSYLAKAYDEFVRLRAEPDVKRVASVLAVGEAPGQLW